MLVIVIVVVVIIGEFTTITVPVLRFYFNGFLFLVLRSEQDWSENIMTNLRFTMADVSMQTGGTLK